MMSHTAALIGDTGVEISTERSPIRVNGNNTEHPEVLEHVPIPFQCIFYAPQNAIHFLDGRESILLWKFQVPKLSSIGLQKLPF